MIETINNLERSSVKTAPNDLLIQPFDKPVRGILSLSVWAFLVGILSLVCLLWCGFNVSTYLNSKATLKKLSDIANLTLTANNNVMQAKTMAVIKREVNQ